MARAGESAERGLTDMAPKKGPNKGTGGHGRKKLEGRGPTPKAEERTKHPAGRHARFVAKRAGQGGDRFDLGDDRVVRTAHDPARIALRVVRGLIASS